MRKVAWAFVLAVILPSLILAWLAVRSLRDQQFLLERQQSLLYQGVTDGVAKDVQDVLGQFQHTFTAKTVLILQQHSVDEASLSFDELLRKEWNLARVAFTVTLNGKILSPSLNSRPEAETFLAANGRFLGNCEPAEVYSNPKQALMNSPSKSTPSSLNYSKLDSAADNSKSYDVAKNQLRNVIPQQQGSLVQQAAIPVALGQQPSKVAASEAEFRQLIGEDVEGTMARFVDNHLSLLFWCRRPGDPQTIFGAEVALPRLKEELRPLIQQIGPSLKGEICLALLDDSAKPVALSEPTFQANWKRPFVATELGEVLPHWEAAVYLLDPGKLQHSAQTLKLTLGLIILLLLLAIGIGSWLIVADLKRELRLAREKTDFVSSVSHELKTPLTSIRMFSELLAEGRVENGAKRRFYLGIITAETARLTRLINNVLDFSRMERGEKHYTFEQCDLVNLTHETVESYRAHLEASGFQLRTRFPESPIFIKGDRDALAQVTVNLLSNAEKYCGNRKEITVELQRENSDERNVEVRVLDRGLGVPQGREEKIFERFYRAHDSLSSGIQGCGLGLTLARQIARAHGGDVIYEPREGGGSCFALRLPLDSVSESSVQKNLT
jgi:signal transduction histidine kinase